MTLLQRASLLLVSLLLLGAMHPTGNALTGSTFTSSSTVYVVNTFSSAGSTENWTIPFGVSSIDAIAVGGGGGAGADGGNGGGGGELRVLTSQPVTAGNVMSAIVGAGGLGTVWSPSSASTDGSATYLKKDGTTLLQANGGAKGLGWSSSQNYAAGGSGGVGGTGYQGGTGGLNRYQQNEGIGGNGSNGPTTTLVTGSTSYYGGGGGGGSCFGSYNSGVVAGTSGGAGGGGGGAGHTATNGSPAGTPGTANTGGGGGGGSACDAFSNAAYDGSKQRTNGGNGGSGVVVIRYILTAPNSLDLDTASDSGSSNSDNLTNDSTPTISGSAIGGSTIQLYVDGSASGSSCLANSTTGAWSCTTGVLASGAKSIVARATIGGAVKDSSALSITIDTTAPALTPSASISIAENLTNIATVSCNESCTLTMTSGSDSASVTFNTATGALAFRVAPDYEAPGDVGADRTYQVIIQGTDSAANSTSVTYSITVTNSNETSTVDAPTISGTIYKGVATTISVTINTAGKVRFFANGKRISTCKDRTTSGSYPNNTATCSWKPPVTGKQLLTATLTPTDSSFSGSTSSPTIAWVQKRTTTR